MKNDQQQAEGERLGQRVQAQLESTASRRSFLAGAAKGAATLAVSSSGCTGGDSGWQRFFQAHYKEMSAEEKDRVFDRVREQARRRHGTEIELDDPSPIPGVSFAFCISLSMCNGNRRCVYACAKENNLPADSSMHYIKVIELERGTLDPQQGNLYYEGDVPQPGKVYLPVQCNQCADPPCVSACPVDATWAEEDGIVVIDYDWCIGCRYCMAACPYEARRFNFADPQIADGEVNPQQAYLGNRVREAGVVEKCHFCIQRTRRGLYPACLEVCPTGARKFGDLNDPESEVSRIVREKRVFALREELKTFPRVFYYFD